jgi:hypothetical protein
VASVRRSLSSSPSGAAAAPRAAAGPSGYYQPGGSADTTGTDLSSFLGNWGEAQQAAQTQFLSNLTTALGQAGPAQNDDVPPALVWSKGPDGKPVWGLLNSPYGGWMQTDAQSQANTWASQWGGSDNTADFVSWDAWTKLKDRWNK